MEKMQGQQRYSNPTSSFERGNLDIKEVKELSEATKPVKESQPSKLSLSHTRTIYSCSFKQTIKKKMGSDMAYYIWLTVGIT